VADKLCSFELDVLRDLNGEKVDGLIWGAGYMAALEFLCGSGLVAKRFSPGAIRYEITDAGRELLAAKESA
jgi:hypothetical protein